MAILVTAVWEGRTTGSTLNGGGYDPGIAGAGTDYSQQDSPQLTVTDGAVTAGTAALTSATGGFTSAMIGNALYESGDPKQRYFITAVGSSNACTLDRNVTTGGTGLTVRVGGAISDITKLIDSGTGACYPVAGNDVFVKYHASNTYDVGAAMSVSRGAEVGGRFFRVIGYDTNRSVTNRDANRPILRRTANITIINAVAHGTTFRNLSFNSNGFGSSVTNVNANSCLFYRCYAFGTGNPVFFDGTNPTYQECEVVDNGAGIAFNNSSTAINCKATINTGVGFSIKIAVNCLVIGTNTSGGRGFSPSTGTVYVNCTAYNLLIGFNGFSVGRNATCMNCLAHTCGTGYLSVSTQGSRYLFAFACATYNCTTPYSAALQTSQMFGPDGAQLNIVNCSSDPLTNAAGGDFSLNTVAAGGALLRNKGFGVLGISASITSYPDIGALQHVEIGRPPTIFKSTVVQ